MREQPNLIGVLESDSTQCADRPQRNRSRRRPAHGQHICRQQRRPVTTRPGPAGPVSREPRAPRPTNYPGGSSGLRYTELILLPAGCIAWLSMAPPERPLVPDDVALSKLPELVQDVFVDRWVPVVSNCQDLWIKIFSGYGWGSC